MRVMSLQTNISAQNAKRQLANVSARRARSAEKLSSGYRINRAADDAAGLSMSQKMKRQIRGLTQGLKNAEDGMSLLNVGDGALHEVQAMLNRMSELAIKAGNDTLQMDDRLMIQQEIAHLTTEIDRVSATTNFNHVPLFDGSAMAGPIEYSYGLKRINTYGTPAGVTAAADFSPPVRILPSNFAAQSVPNSNLAALDAGPSFPQSGVFVMQITLPGSATRNEYIDFAVANADGSLNLADFEAHFQSAFADLLSTSQGGNCPPGSEQLEFEINHATGAITLNTRGYLAGSSQATIGATAGTNLPAGTQYANSAIFGATASASVAVAYANARLDPDILKLANQADLTALQANNKTDTDFWDALPDSHNFILAIERRRLRDGIDHGNSDSDYQSDGAVYQYTFNVGTLKAAGVTTLEEANAYIQSNLNTTQFSSISDITASINVDRDGTIYASFQTSALLKNDTTYPGDGPPANPYYRTIFAQPPVVSYHNPQNQLRSQITSAYPARISENGTLTFTVNGVAGAPAQVTMDWSDPAWIAKTPQDLVDYLNDEFNKDYRPPSSWWDDNAPAFTSTNYTPNFPVAQASLDSQGRLVITTAERHMSVNVQESMPTHSMYVNPRPSSSGESQGGIMNVTAWYHGVPRTHSVAIAPDYYQDIDQFIANNQAAFYAQGLVLGKEGDSLKITTRSVGENVVFDETATVISFVPDQPAYANLGFITGANSSNTFVNGQTLEESKNGLWIQSGSEVGDGLFLWAPSLSVHDLGLAIYSSDHMAPALYHGISGMGTEGYTTMANVSSTGNEWEPKASSLDVTTHEKAGNAMEVIKNAAGIISEERARFGAYYNRMQHTVGHQKITVENTTAANSRIEDADMAEEAMRHFQLQILAQAGQAMVAQANQLSETVLNLL